MDAFDQITIHNVKHDFEKLKKSVSEWVIALDTRQYELERKVKSLEQELRQLKVSRGGW